MPADGGPARREAFPQPPHALAVLDDGWLVVIGEGTQAHGNRDTVVVARPPAAAAGAPTPEVPGAWRLLAEGIVAPGKRIVAAAGWFCFVAGDAIFGATVHCMSPAKRKHLVLPELQLGVGLWGMTTSDTGTRVFVFNDLYSDTHDGRLWSLKLE